MSDETKVNPEEPERALVSRRKFLGGVAGAGIGGLALAGILAACGQDDDGGEAAAPRRRGAGGDDGCGSDRGGHERSRS